MNRNRRQFVLASATAGLSAPAGCNTGDAGSDGSTDTATARPHHHAAMLWFLSDLTSLAHGGWFGYENPRPLIPPGTVQGLADGLARTTMDLFGPADVVDVGSTRDPGLLAGAVGWYGTHAGSDDPAEAVLGLDVRSQFARFFDATFNRGRLQRAERPPSRDESAAHALPLPPAAGGEFGQAAVYNAAVEYDVDADEWSVTDRRFDTEAALYLANQDIWVGQWAGEFFQGRGVPGTSDEPA